MNDLKQNEKESKNADIEWAQQMVSAFKKAEKDFEEFFTQNEVLDMNRFENLGVIKNDLNFEEEKLNFFTETIGALKKEGKWNKEQIVELFFKMIPGFGHKETGKYLDAKM
mgnify:CR=1 FL=1